MGLTRLSHPVDLLNHGNSAELVPVAVGSGEQNRLQLRDKICLVFVAPRFERRSNELDPFGKQWTHVKVFAHSAAKETIEDPAAVNSSAFLVGNHILSTNRVSDHVYALAARELHHFLSDALLLVVDDKVCAHLVSAECKFVVSGCNSDGLSSSVFRKL